MTCPLCNSSNTSPVERKDENGNLEKTSFHFIFGVKFLRCRECTFVFADFIHPDLLDFYYRKMCRKGVSGEDLNNLRKSSRENGLSQLRYLEPYLPREVMRVLDFGGGAGEAARLYVDKAETVFITEKDARYSEELRDDPNLSFIEDDVLDDAKYRSFFDLVIHSNTLEHMIFPVYQLARLSRIISPGGLLFIEIPNEAELAADHNYYGRQHVVFFSVETARLLVERQGSFDIVDIRTCNQSLSELKETWVMKWEYDRLLNEDGRTIRMILRNERPVTDVEPTEMSETSLDEACSALSNNLYEMSEILGRV